jgi:transglutaminase-like putative cysteine protease
MQANKLSWLLLLAASAAAHAAPTTTLKYDVVYELLPDGTSTVERHVVTRINEQSAVTGAGQVGLQFSESLQELEIIAAYTTTKDGNRIDVPADRIITQQSPISAGAPMFSDYKAKVVVFPQVEIGASLTLHYRQRQLKPFLPGVFTAGESLSRFAEIQATKSITLRAPENVTMYVFARDVEGGPVPSTKTGMKEWRWSQGPNSAEVPEPGMVDPGSISPGVMFSTLKDYPALADAYMAGAAPMAKVTPAVQKLADEITKGITGRRQQAEAIYRWVSGEIRYVAIAMGVGGYVPHAADEIIAARYGDCKDKTTLLTALLQAKGIRALPVLILVGNRYKWQEVPLLGAFNHAITFVPEFDLYLDATVAMAPFDALPSQLRGRPVLVAGDAGTKASVRQTPAIDAARDRELTITTATVAPDGTVVGTTRMLVHGGLDAQLRTMLSSIPELVLPQLGNQLLAGAGQTGSTKLAVGNLRDFTTPNLLTIEFNSPGRISLPGPGALTGGFGASGPSPGRGFSTGMLQLERKLDFPCPAGGSEQRLELTLPEGMKITALPPAADIQSSHGRFTASYEVKDGKLLMAQKLDLKQPASVCTATDYAELRKFATAIDRELRRQVLYE